jgi:SPX domain protein involved in polyphosphate accumulation
VERKTHHDSWIGESSVKQRFTISTKRLYDYTQGNYTLDEKLKKALQRKEMKEKEVQETLKLSHEIQDLILSKKLQPTVITRYTRTAFQLGRDATVRMSLDTDLHMIAEHGYQGNRY